MSSYVLQYTHIHTVKFPLDIFATRENSFSNCTALHNMKETNIHLEIMKEVSETIIQYYATNNKSKLCIN